MKPSSHPNPALVKYLVYRREATDTTAKTMTRMPTAVVAVVSPGPVGTVGVAVGEAMGEAVAEAMSVWPTRTDHVVKERDRDMAYNTMHSRERIRVFRKRCFIFGETGRMGKDGRRRSVDLS
jgi:hypothetical protein